MRIPAFPGTHYKHVALHILAAGLGLTLVSTLAACGRSADSPSHLETHATAARPDVDELLSAMLSPAGPTTAEDALRALPHPSNTASRTVIGIHGGTAQVTTLSYDGLEVTTYAPGQGQATLLVALRLTSGSAPNHDLTIGMDAGQARARFVGARALPVSPGATASFSVEDAPLSAPYQVDLTSEAGALKVVTWSAYLD